MSSKVIKTPVSVFFLLLIILALTGLSTASNLKNPDINGKKAVNNSLNFTVQVQNSSKLDNPKLFLKKPEQPWKAYNLTYSNNLLYKNISDNIFNLKGSYNYYFSVGGLNFPKKGGMAVRSDNRTLYNASKNFTKIDYSGFSLCGSEKCGYENWQGWATLSLAKAYKFTRNETYRKAAENFSLGEYSYGGYSTCNPDDFNCNTSASGDHNYTGGLRQGVIIYSLLETYDIIGNSSIRKRAFNYVKGSAEDCDVWKKDFNCSTSESQSSMMLGYWKAYEMTGNSTYRNIAENLSSTTYSGPRVAEALIFGYSLTGNESYRKKAENITQEWIEKCPNCSKTSLKDLKKALWRGYKITGSYGYYGNALDFISVQKQSTCGFSSGYSCSTGQLQALSALASWATYYGKKDVSPFLAGSIEGKAVSGQELTVKPVMDGNLKNLTLNLGLENSTFRCKIDFFDGCTVPGDVIYNQSVYSYWFSSETLRFPENGSFRFATNLVDESILQTGQNFATAGSDYNRCDIWSGDYSCEEEAYQAYGINFFSEFFRTNRSSQYLIRISELASPPYNIDVATDEACLPSQNDFSCRNEGYVAQEFNGSQRQGLLIKSLFNAYQVTDNETYYQMALNYSRGSAEDCNVWNSDFTCSNNRGQAAMINGYWKAYKVTGNDTYRNLAVNLSKKALNMSYSSSLGSAIWKTYSLTSNSSYRDFAANATAKSVECTGGCSPLNFASKGLLLHDAYVYGSESYLGNYSEFFENSTVEGGCVPGTDYTCNNPRTQALMGEVFRTGAYTLPVGLKVNTTLEAPGSVELDSSFKATCSVKNILRNSTLYDLKLGISAGSGLDVSGNASVVKGNLSYGEKASYNWTVQATSSGEKTLNCSITSTSGLDKELTASITVSKPETESDGQNSTSETTDNDGGNSWTGPIDTSPQEDTEKLNKTLSYNYTQKNFTEAFLEQRGLNTTLYRFESLRACTEASRTVTENISRLELGYTCGKITGNFVIIDKIPENSSVQRQGNWTVKRTSNLTEAEIVYRGNISEKGWERPYVLSYSKKPVKVQFDTAQKQNGSTAVISAELSRETTCKVFKQDRMVYSENTSQLRYNANLSYGNSTYRVKCGSQSFTQTFTHERPETEDPSTQVLELPVYWILGILFLVSLGTGLYYRDEIVDTAEMKLFEYRFSKFRSAVEDGDTAAAIGIFESMSRDVSQEVLESDMDLMQGLLLYLLLELVEEGKEDDVEFDVSDDLEQLVTRYLEDSEGKAAILVEQKFDEVMEKEVEVV